ncbi:hypothetical protein [Bythopirellula polymerisocia]|uniref:Bacterial type II secretion system protein G n=1 Tax=Bythopirellula polymerisocia TaxID=2528003 RepID=A0A5C6D318_9BACT|nr:hypothetical protein [Bythopirellula polymerisocia]TWU30047.1 hypothetical protein Pla144_08330 [Bythopirellula polymerisocia]
MHHEPADSSSKKFWWFAGFALCLPLAWFLYQLFGPNDEIIVSPETTVITEPLRRDGLPDYARYFYELGHEGVTPENNGAVEFWQAMWPGDLDPNDWQAMCDALGMEIPAEDSGLEPPYSRKLQKEIAVQLTEHYKKTLESPALEDLTRDETQSFIQQTLADEAIGEAMEHPWRTEQLPAMGEWIQRYEKQLDLLVEASNKPKYWSPSPSLLGNNFSGLITVLLPGIQNMRNAARGLNARAMWNLGEGRNEAAWADLLACHRLARFLSQDPTLVGQLVAIAIDGITCPKTVILLHASNTDAQSARQILRELTEMGPASNIVRSLDTGERLMFTDLIIGLATQRDTLSSLTGAGPGQVSFDPLTLVSIDWNYVLREGNRWYDQLVAAARKPTRAERKAAFDQFDADVNQTATRSSNPFRLLGGVVSTKGRSQILADTMAGLMLPALDAAYQAEVRGLVLLELTRVAAALAVYRAEHGEYPEQLAALVPDVLPEMPLDLYSDEPFKYERKPDGGYLLYSVFTNGKDDGGLSYDGEIVAGEWVSKQADLDYLNSDVVFRVPVPDFKLPDFPVEEDTVANPVE